jgi:hypothetical protein
MPRKPIDYSKTIIYKIEHNVDKSLCYVGSTIDFTVRKSMHKTACVNPNNPHHNTKIYIMIRENGGWNSFQMLEIKKFPCNDSNEARAEEERCRVELNANLNDRKCCVEKLQGDRDRHKKHYELHKEEYKLKNALYRKSQNDRKSMCIVNDVKEQQVGGTQQKRRC